MISEKIESLEIKSIDTLYPTKINSVHFRAIRQLEAKLATTFGSKPIIQLYEFRFCIGINDSGLQS